MYYLVWYVFNKISPKVEIFFLFFFFSIVFFLRKSGPVQLFSFWIVGGAAVIYSKNSLLPS